MLHITLHHTLYALSLSDPLQLVHPNRFTTLHCISFQTVPSQENSLHISIPARILLMVYYPLVTRSFLLYMFPLRPLASNGAGWARAPPTEGRGPPTEVGPHFSQGGPQGTNSFRLEFINESLNLKMYSA